MPRKPLKKLVWNKPPKVKVPAIKGREKFPGKDLLEKGARWLIAGQTTNIQLETCKGYAKRCFQNALRECNSASVEAKRSNKPDESRRLAEISTWIEQQYIDTL